MILGFNIGFLEINWVDVFDILLVSVLLYQVYKLMKGSVAVRIFMGILFLYLIYLIIKAAQMELLSLILGQFMGVGVIAAIILFQPELRKFFLLLGRSTEFNKENILKSFMVWRTPDPQKEFNITAVVEACKILGGSNTGALIVFSRDSPLKFYAESGDLINAEISKRLLLSIFNKYSPLHDGAVILYKGKIKAARCILPVTENDKLPAQFGLRHRAAMGMSEVTDTLVLVVSEETGQISLVKNGVIDHNLAPPELRKKINEYLFEEKEEAEKESTEKSGQEAEVSPGAQVEVKEAKAG